MGVKSALQLLLLAAIWGASFLFMRIGAPSLGPVWLIEARVGFAALFLCVVALLMKKSLSLRQNWKHFLFLGVMSSALPFLCYGYAAQYLTASMMSIVNALTPVFGTAIAALYFRTPLSRNTVIGLALGVLGVSVIVGFDPELFKTQAWFAVFVVLGAPLCYGIATTYTQVGPSVAPFENAQGSMLMATFALLPIAMFFTPNTTPNATESLSVIALGVLCTGVAYLIFFKLLGEIGAPSLLTVTFLIPIFGVLWGVMFLDEKVGIHTFVGGVLVILGTMRTTGFSFKKALKSE
ncbi:DMT family transporter [Marinomonas sp. 15G1-11]|uniref:DMT family transporter n=1 Tax=Marinomonas phaeophyticola TaxID=3004091 RepID=A0ABT4JU07_9GAMM|nr:DMT family transporter [Marinomonas sp. 15G1-11]MCZ2721869.1 DMT family transporter [Marinomonas sp. 15G1-11]